MPFPRGGDKLKDIKYSTASEKKMIQEIQRKVGAYDNGIIGTQTLSDIAIALGAIECFPVTLQMYGYPVIIGKDLIAWSPKSAISGYKDSMLGSFTYPRATTPCSFLINNGVCICGTSCHAHINKPESVIYKLNDGTLGIKRALTVKDLPKNIKWAVGGMGLCGMYNPAAEGFTGAYSDVLRKTNHNVLGIKNGMVYGVYYKNMTGQQINEHCKDRMQFEKAILLDGGGLAAINGAERFAKINTGCKQGYAIQFI